MSTALADQLADGPRPDRCQLPPQVLGDRKEERLDHLGRAPELGPQVLALRGDAGRTGVEVALARHVAADRDQRRRPEGELLGTEQRRDQQVPPGLEAAVGAQRDAVAEIVPEQHLVDFAEPELPRRADVLDRRQRRRPGPAGMTRQVDVPGACLGHAGRDRADAAARDELDADARVRVDRSQVGDQLGEVLDGVDVVVRWRADVALPGLTAAKRRDVRRRFPAGELATLARLRALGDLDLELVRSGEVRCGDPEPRRRDLLDARVATSAVRVGGVPRRILAALPGVRGPAGPLDPDRQRLVRLGRQRPDAHRRDDEPPRDGAGALDLTQRHARRRASHPQTVARHRGRINRPRQCRLIPGQRPVDADGLIERRRDAGQRLHLAGDPRREQVRLAVTAVPRKARVGQSGLAAGRGFGDRDRGVSASEQARAEIGERRRPRPCRGAREATRQHVRGEVDRVDERPADVARDRADAHPGQRLAESGDEGVDEVGDRHGRCQRFRAARAGKLRGELQGEPRMDRGRTDRHRHGHRVDVEDVSGIEHDVGATAQTGIGQRGVHGAHRERRRDRQPIERQHRVADDDDLRPATARGHGPLREALERAGEPTGAVDSRPRGVELRGTAATRGKLVEERGKARDDGPLEADRSRTARRAAEQRRSTPELDPHVHHDPLTLRIDRRVGDLGECLAEVVGDRPVEPGACPESACRRPCSTAVHGPRAPSS